MMKKEKMSDEEARILKEIEEVRALLLFKES